MTRSLRLDADGSVSVLDHPPAVMGPFAVRVDVAFAGISHRPRRLPALLGNEFVGAVVDVGPEVIGIAVGDTVAGVAREGACATDVVAASNALIRLDPGLADLDGIMIPRAGLGAFAALSMAAVEPEDTVLLVNARGSASCIAAGLCIAHGATLIATCGSDAVSTALAPLGIAATIIGPPCPDPRQLRRASQNRPIAAVLDFAPNSTETFASIDLSSEARIIRVHHTHNSSPLEPNPVPAPPGISTMNLLRFIADDQKRTQHAIRLLMDALQRGQLSVPTETWSLGAADQAVNRLKSGHVVGKLLIAPNSTD